MKDLPKGALIVVAVVVLTILAFWAGIFALFLAQGG